MTAVVFTIGLLIAISWSHLFTTKVSLCMLAQNPAAYDGKTIRVEAEGSVISSSILGENLFIIGESGCEVPDAWASVVLDAEKKASYEVNEFVNSPKFEIRNARVVVEGQFDQWASLGCFSPQFGIKAAKVGLVSPVTFESLPEMPAPDSR